MFGKTVKVPPMNPVQIVNMPRSPWIDLPEDQGYAWSATLGGAIAWAKQGIVTVLVDADGERRRRDHASAARPLP